ncbi:unnamed protein product [Rotaria sp. Silwood2]|nr:unnamed protein product [Rotaria sp. Silwood2]
MDDDSPLVSRTLSIESMDVKTAQQTDQDREISHVSQNESENQFISQICELLSLEEAEHESRIIARQLLINGRQELVHHRDNIAPIDFENQMDKKGNSTLLEILKRYFQQQWQRIPFHWFNAFITGQQSEDNGRHYQQVLTRTAEYGQKYMRECPVYSIVLQLVFIFNDDINMDETKFDQVWNTFAMEGCKTTLKKWKKYIVSAVMKVRVDSLNSPLFLALREYFREPALSLLEQSNISNRRNLLEIALDCLANDGWVVGLNDVKVKELISPKNHKLLMDNLRKYLKIELPLPSEPSPRPTFDNDFQPPANDPIVAYIPELPLHIVDNHKLEVMIRRCLERKHKQEVADIKCDTHLGIGIVYLQNCTERDHLIKVIESIILDSGEKDNIIIKFVSDLELISYVVIDSTNYRDLPSPNEVAQRCVELYKFSHSVLCEQLSIQFPNIFQIVSNSLDELIEAIPRKTFSINGQNATVYFRADCCFLEELPRHTNINQLRHVITDQISQENTSTESIYIQYNQATTNAVVLTRLSARRWALFDSINLDGRRIQKKNSLPYRLLVHPIPKDLSISHIKNHKIFENTVDQVLVKDDRLIVELSDKIVYEKCVNQGALRAGDQFLFVEDVQINTSSKNSEEREINAENWYETEMCKHEPDIMPFISNPKHPIFRWKWNPQAFQEQYRRYATIQRRDMTSKPDRRGIDDNQKRHLLRVTVMLNTIGTVWRGGYRVGEREIKIKEDLLKTIVYDHRSKLQHGATMSLFEATKVPYTSTLIKVVDEDCLYVYQRLIAQKCRPVLLNMANADSPGGSYRQGAGAQEETLFRCSNYFRSLDTDLDGGKSTSRFCCNSNCELEILSERQRMYPMEEFGAIYTSGLTVFRRAEDTGYAFMDEPLSNVCAIAMTAYRDPKVENNRLTRKFSIGMRKKIENIFAIAYHHKHDCLILSALGCGAFKNPPKHIATIFKSVAEQYAGFFKSIYFAIVDDHNTGLQFNPQGNYRPFKQLLDEPELESTKHKMKDMMIGPRRILNMPNPQQVTLSDIRISYLIPCYHGGKCNDIEDAQHCREYSHPSLCPSIGSGTTCKLSDDEDHMLWFIHRSKCPYDSDCQLVRADVKHANQFEHPQYSLVQPTKLVPCRDSINCLCQEDTDHMKTYSHPCPYTELCRQKIREPHLTHESYVVGSCSNGKSCRILDDPLHRAKYRHTDMPDLLIPCRYQQQCHDKSYEHRIKYSHGEYVELSPKDTYSKGSPPPISPLYQDRTLDYKQLTPCRHGLGCPYIYDTHHRSQYSHSDEQHHRSGESNHRQKIPCKHGIQCRDIGNPNHRSKYLHPDY